MQRLVTVQGKVGKVQKILEKVEKLGENKRKCSAHWMHSTLQLELTHMAIGEPD